MGNWPSLQRVVLVFAFAGLAVVAVGLLESVLPYKWRHAIHRQIEQVFPSEKYDPHPAMLRLQRPASELYAFVAARSRQIDRLCQPLQARRVVKEPLSE